jgi:undecaprenyl-diphosphatase
VPSILKMVILGVVQGATEFLPVSSSGHLTISQEILGITENRILFDVFLHVGTLVAILLVFGRDLLALFTSKKRWIPYLALASVPAAVVGLTLRSLIEKAFESGLAVGVLLVGNSLILAAGSVAQRRGAVSSEVKSRGALVVGFAQSAAILPGISRSGSTVCSALLMGWERTVAVRFSFLLAIPAIVGAGAFEMMKCRSALAAQDVLGMAVTGLLVSAAAGYAALRLFLRTLEKGKLWIFSAYCLVVGAALIVYEVAQ